MARIKGFKLTADWATALGTWFTIILVAVSTILVWKQVRDLKTSVENQTYQSVYETEFDLHKYFLEPDHAKYRPYFYGNLDIDPNLKDDDPEKIKLDTLAEWWCDFFDNVYQQKATMKTVTFDKWRQFMKDIYQTSPVLRKFISIRGERWYTKEFIADISCPTLEKCR